jgi:hypothetical protein
MFVYIILAFNIYFTYLLLFVEKVMSEEKNKKIRVEESRDRDIQQWYTGDIFHAFEDNVGARALLNIDVYDMDQPSDYTKFYIELLEEFGENYVFSIDEFDKITKEALFSDSNSVLNYFLGHNMIKSYKGGVELILLDTEDSSFLLLPEPDQNALRRALANLYYLK